MNAYMELIDRLLNYCKNNSMVDGVLMIGSRARKERPGDAYADVDLAILVNDTKFFLASDEWLNEVGDVKISFLERTFLSLNERRVLFDGGLDMDILILPVEMSKEILSSKLVVSILRKGYKILLDKTGMLEKYTADLPKESTLSHPDEEEFLDTVKDFWYHLVWTMKKLQRGELWAAKFCLDHYMKQKLLWMMECCMHTRKGLDYNTWYGGRFLEFWLDEDILEDLRSSFSDYSHADMLRALTENTVLFRRLAKETAEALSYEYPHDADKYAAKLIHTFTRQYQSPSDENSMGNQGDINE